MALLLQHKAPLHGLDGCGATPVALAAANGHAAVVARLLKAEKTKQKKKAKCCDELVNAYGRSPLWKACAGGHGPVVEVLLRHGCDPFRPDDQGVTPRAVAEEKGYADVVRLIDVRTHTWVEWVWVWMGGLGEEG